jgi:hypothetical protein
MNIMKSLTVLFIPATMVLSCQDAESFNISAVNSESVLAKPDAESFVSTIARVVSERPEKTIRN